jgi:8-oxo-dGTP pyrophosphatase MutT (NUDIX family)
LSSAGGQPGGSGPVEEPVGPGRHFTVAVFVIDKGRVVLMRHPTTGLWLPPGGHVEPGETPDQTAVREVAEETGLTVELLGERGPDCGVVPLARPLGIQLEPIGPGHEHIDLIYVARPRGDCRLRAEMGTEGLGWYSREEAVHAGANAEVLTWISRVLREIACPGGERGLRP